MKNKKIEKVVIGFAIGIPAILIIIFIKNPAVVALFTLFGVIAIYELSQIGRRVNARDGIQAFVFFGVIFVGIPFLITVHFLLRIGYLWTIYFMFNVYLNDVGGWIFGGLIAPKIRYQPHIMFASVSEKKSIEGALFGFVSAIFISRFILFQFMPHSSLLTSKTILPLTIIVSIGAIVGDLAESQLKRLIDIKDTGRTLASHGGFLDRIDSAVGGCCAIIVYLALRQIAIM